MSLAPSLMAHHSHSSLVVSLRPLKVSVQTLREMDLESGICSHAIPCKGAWRRALTTQFCLHELADVYSCLALLQPTRKHSEWSHQVIERNKKEF